MKAQALAVVASLLLAGGAGLASDTDPLSTKRPDPLTRGRREALPHVSRPSGHDDAKMHEESKQIDELRAVGRHEGGRGGRGDGDGEGGDE
ncbi:MAG TPA: hypothetical protein VMS22_07165 [Candidatus Eisenbacteria bacterium]|nr:hypothetical protein [Candidatus Eisenbacteria bacterium]